MINDRLFGSDIPPGVKQKLRDRQEIISPTVPFETLQSTTGFNIKNDFDGQADLSSRTAFARMWTAVRLIKAPTREETAKSVVIDNIKEEDILGTKVYMVGTNNLSTISQVYNDATENKQMTIDAGGGKSQWSKEQLDKFDEYERKQNLQYGLFPPEHGIDGDHNKFLKPQAGITSVSTETEGVVGELKSTTVNFIVHNFHDYDQIYNKFFLKPNALIYVDYGWNTLTRPLYNPNELIKLSYSDSEKFLYAEQYITGDNATENGWVTENAGDANTAVGFVKDYTAKILPNGSVECSVTLQGKNQLLTDKKVTVSEDYRKENYKKFIKKLDEEILFEQIYSLGDDDAKSTLNLAVENLGTNASNYDDFKTLIKETANTTFGGDKYTPTTAAALSGLYIKGTDTYINWGLFEDTFLNNYFASGENLETVNNNTGTAGIVKFDSSNSFAVFKNALFLRQGDELDSPPFLVPEQWDYTYNTRLLGGQGKSGLTEDARIKEIPNLTKESRADTKYAFKKHFFKSMNEFNSNQTNNNDGTFSRKRFNYLSRKYPALMQITNYDWSQYRIPLREVFVDTRVIKNAFEINSDNTLKDVIDDILGEINKVFGSVVWDWKITGNGNTDISIQDLNYNPQTRANYDIQLAEEKNKTNRAVLSDAKFGNVFTFNIMGENSMVTNYDVSTNFPQGDLGNMVAVSAMIAQDAKYYPPSALLNKAGSMATLFTKYTDDKEAITDVMFQYLPIQGNYESDVLANDTNENDTNYNSYKTTLDILQNKSSTTDGISYGGINNYLSEEDVANSKALAIKDPPGAKNTNLLTAGGPNISNIGKTRTKGNLQATINEGKNLHQNSTEYWTSILQAEAYTDEVNLKTMPLPINLTLTVYGIGTMQVGDIFRVDYLPQIYLQRVYFQTMKVIQNLDSTGWYTTLETQYNVLPEEIQNNVSTTATKTTKGFESGINLRKKNNPLDQKTFVDILSSEKYKATAENFIDIKSNYDEGLKQYWGTDNDMHRINKDDRAGSIFNTDIRTQTYVNPDRFSTAEDKFGIYQFTTQDRVGDGVDGAWDQNWPDATLASSRKDKFIPNITSKDGTIVSILVNKNIKTLSDVMTNLRTVTDPTLENETIKVWLFKLNTLKYLEDEAPENYKGDIWINNPTYFFKGVATEFTTPESKYARTTAYDGWGMGGNINYYLNNTTVSGANFEEIDKEQPGGVMGKVIVCTAGKINARNALYKKFTTNGYYGHDEECYLIVSTKSPKCWAVIPKKEGGLGKIVDTYDLREIGGACQTKPNIINITD